MSELEQQLVMTKEHSWIFAYPKSEADKVIAELKDKCQMHNFFCETWAQEHHSCKRSL